MKKWHLIFILSILGFYSSSWASQFNYESQWELETSGLFEKVTANFNAGGGGFSKLPEGYLYQSIQVNPHFRWAIQNTGFLGGALYGYSISEDGEIRRTNGAFDHYYLGLDYRIKKNEYSLIPRFKFYSPLFENDINGDKVSVGDGVTKWELGGALRTHWILPLYLDISYVHQSFLAQLLKFEMLSRIQTKKNSWYLQGGVGGKVTLIGETDSLSRQLWYCRVNGCSQKNMSLNPQMLELIFQVGLPIGQSSTFALEARQTINGQRDAYLTQVGAVLILRADEKIREKRGYNPSDVFIEDTQTEVDPHLFSRPKVINPSKEKPQQQLDKLEMQLELKRKNNRKR